VLNAAKKPAAAVSRVAAGVASAASNAVQDATQEIAYRATGVDDSAAADDFGADAAAYRGSVATATPHASPATTPPPPPHVPDITSGSDPERDGGGGKLDENAPHSSAHVPGPHPTSQAHVSDVLHGVQRALDEATSKAGAAAASVLGRVELPVELARSMRPRATQHPQGGVGDGGGQESMGGAADAASVARRPATDPSVSTPMVSAAPMDVKPAVPAAVTAAGKPPAAATIAERTALPAAASTDATSAAAAKTSPKRRMGPIFAALHRAVHGERH
jgi:hypothetical protein